MCQEEGGGPCPCISGAVSRSTSPGEARATTVSPATFALGTVVLDPSIVLSGQRSCGLPAAWVGTAFLADHQRVIRFGPHVFNCSPLPPAFLGLVCPHCSFRHGPIPSSPRPCSFLPAALFLPPQSPILPPCGQLLTLLCTCFYCENECAVEQMPGRCAAVRSPARQWDIVLGPQRLVCKHAVAMSRGLSGNWPHSGHWRLVFQNL